MTTTAKGFQAHQIIAELEMGVEGVEEPRNATPKLLKALYGPRADVDNNRAYIPHGGDALRQAQTISATYMESGRESKRQQALREKAECSGCNMEHTYCYKREPA